VGFGSVWDRGEIGVCLSSGVRGWRLGGGLWVVSGWRYLDVKLFEREVRRVNWEDVDWEDVDRKQEATTRIGRMTRNQNAKSECQAVQRPGPFTKPGHWRVARSLGEWPGPLAKGFSGWLARNISIKDMRATNKYKYTEYVGVSFILHIAIIFPYFRNSFHKPTTRSILKFSLKSK